MNIWETFLIKITLNYYGDLEDFYSVHTFTMHRAAPQYHIATDLQWRG
jgi:hypothetical protein